MDDLETAVVGDFIPLDIIKAVERDYNSKLKTGAVDDNVTFGYAWHLVKSRYKSDIRKGIQLLGELCQNGVDQRDYFYFLGVGYYKLEEYYEAEKCVDRVLSMEPNNRQAKDLKQLVYDKIRRDTLITAGVAGGAAVIGAVAIGGVALLGAGILKLVSK